MQVSYFNLCISKLSRAQRGDKHSANIHSRDQQNVLYQEYSLTGIFFLGYTLVMKSLWIALAEPNRLQMVELLREGPFAVGEIADRLGLRQPQVSKHLRVLGDAGLVAMHPLANRRSPACGLSRSWSWTPGSSSFRHVWDEDRSPGLLYARTARKGKETW